MCEVGQELAAKRCHAAIVDIRRNRACLIGRFGCVELPDELPDEGVGFQERIAQIAHDVSKIGIVARYCLRCAGEDVQLCNLFLCCHTARFGDFIEERDRLIAVLLQLRDKVRR